MHTDSCVTGDELHFSLISFFFYTLIWFYPPKLKVVIPRFHVVPDMCAVIFQWDMKRDAQQNTKVMVTMQDLSRLFFSWKKWILRKSALFTFLLIEYHIRQISEELILLNWTNICWKSALIPHINYIWKCLNIKQN